MAQPSGASAQRIQNSQAPQDNSIKLGRGVFLYEPVTQTDSIGNKSNESLKGQTNSSSSPGLIILCSWMGAATKHIAKYTIEYQVRYPQSRLLLIRSSIMDLTIKPLSWQVQNMLEAVKLIQTMVNSQSQQGKKLRILMHNFSNGGNWSAITLAQAYKAGTNTQLPISALISDSAPSLPSVKTAVSAMAQGLGRSIIIRILGLIGIWSMIIMTYIVNRLRLTENTLYKLRRVLNDGNGPFLRANVPRVYICSQTDAMVPMKDVVMHASQARNLLSKHGVSDVNDLIQIEEFQKSKHVGHMMVDKERYWGIVDEIWKRVGS